MPEPVKVSERPTGGNGVVRVRAVTKEVEQEPVLDGVSFDVREGEIFGLLGPSGAGKSSLLGVAAGLRVPASGSVRILGLDPLEDRTRLAGDVAYALPAAELAERATCRENLELRARAGDGGSSADAALAAVGLAARAGVPVAELDAGEKRLIGIACALLSSPRLLFLDEPTADLSPTERERVWSVLRAGRDDGRTSLLATSSLQEALCLCDRAGLLVDGALVAVGTPDEIAADHFPERILRFATVAEPDRASLAELPEVLGMKIAHEADHWAVELSTRQPAELSKLIAADPAAAEIVRIEGVDETFSGGHG